MHLGTMPITRAAMDPIAFFVVAIVVFNIIASIVKSLKKTVAGAASAADAAARQRLTQSLQQAPAPDQITAARAKVAAARAAELARLRQALLAAGGVSNANVDTAAAPTYTVVRQALQPLPATVASAPIPSSMLTQVSPPQEPAGALSTPAPSAWVLQAAGTLMTLESATTAFDRLAVAGTAQAAAQAAAAAAPSETPSSLAVLQLSNTGANLVVAAAIVGPPAAFRSIGHTPGGW